VILETERLVLRPIEPGDGGALFQIMSDPVVMTHWDSAAVEDPWVVEQMIAAQVEDMSAGAACYWAIERAGGKAFLGVCDLSEIDWRHRRGEVGFLLAEPAQRQGYGLEAMRAVVDHAAALGLRRLWARAHVGNTRSERLLERLGFELEGYLRGHVQRAGERRDCKIYGLLL
jgi:ribosomal-protein-alanine N-acetyltransferase